MIHLKIWNGSLFLLLNRIHSSTNALLISQWTRIWWQFHRFGPLFINFESDGLKLLDGFTHRLTCSVSIISISDIDVLKWTRFMHLINSNGRLLTTDRFIFVATDKILEIFSSINQKWWELVVNYCLDCNVNSLLNHPFELTNQVKTIEQLIDPTGWFDLADLIRLSHNWFLNRWNIWWSAASECQHKVQIC